ncbi:hypothetical protein [Vibrio sonorensis]|uniref:hypothetical protein n=1 Tax=Vibrio sonorensis TaxID=1004316 RepID=UPI0008D916B5|nr:hypothetical protein [Vibrio sonorensis]
MKRVLVWFSGTGTEAEKQIEEIGFDVTLFDHIMVSSGVGTAELRQMAEKLTKKDKSVLERLFSATEKTGVLLDKIEGYKERENIVSALQVFETIDYLNALPNDEHVEMVLGGHSRGAAVGLVTFLATLNEQARYSVNEEGDTCWSKVSEIQLVPVDPVAGKQAGSEDTNDMLNLPNDYPMSALLSDIENNLFQGREVFQVKVFCARFDARDEFRFDSRWFEFIQTSQSLARPVTVMSAGFRHSSMVDIEDELLPLYADIDTSPIQLLRSIIEGNSLESIQNDIELIRGVELSFINRLARGKLTEEDQFIEKRTRTDSYISDGIFGRWLSDHIYNGESLMTILHDHAELLNEDFHINRRYLFK